MRNSTSFRALPERVPRGLPSSPAPGRPIRQAELCLGEDGMLESERVSVERDRRKYHRIDSDQVISFAEVDHVDQSAVSRNLSVGGIQFNAVGCEIDYGDVLRITFNVGDQTVVAIGRVVWATDMDPLSIEVGIEFMEIDPVALQLLDDVEAAQL